MCGRAWRGRQHCPGASTLRLPAEGARGCHWKASFFTFAFTHPPSLSLSACFPSSMPLHPSTSMPFQFYVALVPPDLSSPGLTNPFLDFFFSKPTFQSQGDRSIGGAVGLKSGRHSSAFLFRFPTWHQNGTDLCTGRVRARNKTA